MDSVKVALSECMLLCEKIDTVQALIKDLNAEELTVRNFYTDLFNTGSGEHQRLVQVMTDQQAILMRMLEYSKKYYLTLENIAESYGLGTFNESLESSADFLSRKITEVRIDMDLMRGHDKINDVVARRNVAVTEQHELQEKVVATFWNSHSSLKGLYRLTKDEVMTLSQPLLRRCIAKVLECPATEATSLAERIQRYTLGSNFHNNLGFHLVETDHVLETQITCSDFVVDVERTDMQKFDSSSSVSGTRDITIEVDGTVNFDISGHVEYCPEHGLEGFCLEIDGKRYEVEPEFVMGFTASVNTSFNAEYDTDGSQKELKFSIDVDTVNIPIPLLDVDNDDFEEVSDIARLLVDQIDLGDIENKISDTISNMKDELEKELTDLIRKRASLDLDISVK